VFNAGEIVIEAFVRELGEAYTRNYGHLEPSYREILEWAGFMALERLSQSDALYHDVEHTVLVTGVGQQILRGRHIREGGVSPRDWLHFTIALLCHDIGYVRGVCRGDSGDRCLVGEGEETVELPPGATDAFLTPYHVERGIRFIRERFDHHPIIDVEAIAAQIRLTRFPVPDEGDHRDTTGYPGLLRAADLIGQLADPDYLRKLPALFCEFRETGTNARLGYRSPADLKSGYPRFFWEQVHPYIQDALEHLAVTREGRQWTANLFAHVFATEHFGAKA
jgi:hypothetical protein